MVVAVLRSTSLVVTLIPGVLKTPRISSSVHSGGVWRVLPVRWVETTGSRIPLLWVLVRSLTPSPCAWLRHSWNLFGASTASGHESSARHREVLVNYLTSRRGVSSPVQILCWLTVLHVWWTRTFFKTDVEILRFVSFGLRSRIQLFGWWDKRVRDHVI